MTIGKTQVNLRQALLEVNTYKQDKVQKKGNYESHLNSAKKTLSNAVAVLDEEISRISKNKLATDSQINDLKKNLADLTNKLNTDLSPRSIEEQAACCGKYSPMTGKKTKEHINDIIHRLGIIQGIDSKNKHPHITKEQQNKLTEENRIKITTHGEGFTRVEGRKSHLGSALTGGLSDLI